MRGILKNYTYFSRQGVLIRYSSSENQNQRWRIATEEHSVLRDAICLLQESSWVEFSVKTNEAFSARY